MPATLTKTTTARIVTTETRSLGRLLRQMQQRNPQWDHELELWDITLNDGTTRELICDLQTAVALQTVGYTILMASDRVLACNLPKYIEGGEQWQVLYGWTKDPAEGTWATLLSVTDSPAQGVNLNLDGGVTLQACFPTGAIYRLRQAPRI